MASQYCKCQKKRRKKPRKYSLAKKSDPNDVFKVTAHCAAINAN